MPATLRPRPRADHREWGLVLPADEPVLDRVHRGLRAVAEAELAEDVRHVRLHRALRDAKVERDRLVRAAAGELGEDLELARRELVAGTVVRGATAVFGGELLDEHRRDRRCKQRLARVHGPDRARELGGLDVLE